MGTFNRWWPSLIERKLAPSYVLAIQGHSGNDHTPFDEHPNPWKVAPAIGQDLEFLFHATCRGRNDWRLQSSQSGIRASCMAAEVAASDARLTMEPLIQSILVNAICVSRMSSPEGLLGSPTSPRKITTSSSCPTILLLWKSGEAQSKIAHVASKQHLLLMYLNGA